MVQFYDCPPDDYLSVTFNPQIIAPLAGCTMDIKKACHSLHLWWEVTAGERTEHFMLTQFVVFHQSPLLQQSIGIAYQRAT
jgi:hypothetical protein